jgi:hypothetical protein
MSAGIGAEREPDPAEQRFCLACGKALEPTLEHLGSLRCLDCRDGNAQLDPSFVPNSRPTE